MPRWSQSITSAESSLRARRGRVQPPLFSPLLFVMPLAATAQGSPFDPGVSAIKALSPAPLLRVANLVAIVIGGYVFSHLSPCWAELANKSFSTCNCGGELRPSCGGHSPSNRTAIGVKFCGQSADDNFVLERACRYVSRLLLGHSLGTFPAPDSTTPCKVLSSPSQKADHRHLAAGPLAQLPK
jgi:hypothetical protein